MATARDFEFDRIEAFVKKHGATVLALQFPAHLSLIHISEPTRPY